MSKQITFKYGESTYTLEYNKRTVMQAERGGLDVSKVQSAPMDTIYKLFEGAFRKNHPKMDKGKIQEIFESITDVLDWTEDLVELYNDPYNGIEGSAEGEIKRVKNW